MKYVCSKYAKLLFAARELLLIRQQIFYTLPLLNTSQLSAVLKCYLLSQELIFILILFLYTKLF